MKKCVLIYNPESGKARKLIEKESLKDIALKYNYELSFLRTKRNGDATSIVKDLKNIDLVIATGGDGTLHEVVKGNLLRDKQILLGHLPQGTVNDVGKMYGLTKNVEVDLELLFNGKAKNIDTCLINNNPFIYVACFGDLVSVSFDTPRDLKEKFGKFGYIVYGLRKLKRKVKTYNIKYTVNGVAREGNFSFIFITNSDRIAGFSNIYETVKLDDNRFEVVFCKAKNFKECMSVMKDLVVNDAGKIKNVLYFKTNELEIELLDEEKESWCLDGEELKSYTNRFYFSINKDNYMLVPNKNINKLFEK